MSEKTQKKEEDKDSFVDLVRAVLSAGVIAIIIRSFLFEPFNIPSGSMFPTLLVGDYLFVEKYAYGYSQYSFPLDLIPFKGRFFEGAPQRGDVAVFRQPKKPDIDYIKRLIGLPGDRIQMKEGRLYINGEMVVRDFKGGEDMEEDGSFSFYNKFIETLPNGKLHYIYEVSDEAPLDNTEEYVVPEGYYFAMGDNRDGSLDSRVQSEVGFIPAENLIGRAALIFFSIEPRDNACIYEGVFGGVESVACKIVTIPKAIRYSRIFKNVSSL